MSKDQSYALTVFEQVAPGSLEHLERDRWPEFERELRLRRPRKFHFDMHHYGAPSASWEWLLYRCRTWAEAQRVLNRHRVAWERKRGELLIDGATIYRCR